MNDRQPYEEQLTQQWNDLPLPDENVAWADMKRRLEKDDDDAIIPFWLRGCALWGLLAVLLLGLGWWWLRPDKWGNKKQETENIKTTGQEGTVNNDNSIAGYKDTSLVRKKNNNPDSRDSNPVMGKGKNKTSVSSFDSNQEKQEQGKKEETIPIVKNKNHRTRQPVTNQKTGKDIIKNNRKKRAGDDELAVDVQTPGKKKEADNNPADNDNSGRVTSAKDSSISKSDNEIAIDTVKKTASDSLKKKEAEQITKTNEPKKDSSKRKSFSFGAGIAMHQLLPIAGQTFTPYSAQGRESSLADYIPSVYFRMYRDKKWFLQAEFRYGAPQYADNLLYRQSGYNDSIGGISYTTTISYTLKKTFYHQLPVSFNYFILPDWSVGGGFTWNKLYSTVSEENTTIRNNTLQTDSVLPKKIVSSRTDSVNINGFSQSYFQWQFETQYRWKRFSLGARYTFGLQPYLKFSLTGPVQEEKSKSLQVFLRYELWRSKARK